MSRINAAVVLLVGAFGGTAAARDSVGSPDTFSYPLSGLEFARSPVAKSNLLRLVPVERELKLTEAQKKRQAAIFQQRLESMRKALIEYGNEEILAAARNATFADAEAALEVSLEPEQRDRLDQIQLQVQGPLAFTRRDFQERLGLTADQVDDIEPIVERGNDEVEKASSFSLELNRNAMQSAEAIRKLVDGLEFQLKKEQTRHVARASRLGVTVRIVKVLTDSQRVAYRKMLGEPFDIGKLPPGIDTRERDINIIASRLRT
jgi:hypothetical protein